jgi:hypothetical protein
MTDADQQCHTSAALYTRRSLSVRVAFSEKRDQFSRSRDEFGPCRHIIRARAVETNHGVLLFVG